MPKKIQTSLQDYISKMKKPRQRIPLPLSSSKDWILSRCKHPKTLSFAVKPSPASTDADNNYDAATLSDVDRFLFENFKSLYLDDQESSTNGVKRAQNDPEPDRKTGNLNQPVLFESPRFVNPPPDLCRSRRFFVAPGASGSLMEEARTSYEKYSGASSSTATTTTTTNNDSVSSVQLPEQCIAVLTQSTRPAEDFRRSMQEVIEAKLEQEEDNKVDWEYMEELLFCYLNMNDKKSYKYILGAFVDEIVQLRQRADDGAPARARSFPRSRRKNRGAIRMDN